MSGARRGACASTWARGAASLVLGLFVVGALSILTACTSEPAASPVRAPAADSSASPAQATESGAQRALVLPSPRQLERAKLEMCAFVHFGMNTFTDREWGDGTEDPKLFAPTDLDCDQWVKVFAEAGFRGVILTAKHHDGFCLWPSKYTEHSVKHSPWKNGQGDVVRELSDACRRANLKFGIYLSPWDRHSPLYGDVDRYNDYYAAQLTELLTNYGDIFEVWWDGACGEGPNGKRQTYDWPRFTEIVRRLQPNAVIFSDAGPDLRWVGNENGFAGETCWSTFSNEGIVPGTPGIEKRLNEGDVDGTHWIPPECDVSIRPGWFHHPAEDDKLKTVDQLMAIWKASVGRNGLLLLNVPADKRGRIALGDEMRLIDFGAAVWRYTQFPAESFPFGEHNVRFLDLRRKERVDRVFLSEFVDVGQFVDSFELAARTGDTWTVLKRGTTIGRSRWVEFEPVETDRLRLRLTNTRGVVQVDRFQAYGPQPSTPKVRFVTPDRGLVAPATIEVVGDDPGASVSYFLAHEDRVLNQTRRAPITIADPGTYTIVAAAWRNRPRLDDETVWGERVIATYHVGSSAVPLPRAWHSAVTRPGLGWKTCALTPMSVDELEQQTLRPIGFSLDLSVDVTPRDPTSGLLFFGWIMIPEDGGYTFGSKGSEAVLLMIDGHTLLRPAHTGRSSEQTGSLALRSGLHEFRLAWSDPSPDSTFELWWTGPSFERQRVPASVWRH